MTQYRSGLVMSLFFAGLLPAQDFRATITGRVTDTSTASVPRAEVIVTHVETNTKASTQTDERGDYTMPLLRPGLYHVRATAPGFKQYIREGVSLSVGQTATLDILLEVGNITEQVIVSTEVPLLETASSSRGAVIDNKRVSALPLNGRNPFMLAVLASGVNFAGRSLNTRPFDNNFGNSFSMNGSRNSASEFLLDGAPNNSEAGTNSIALVPSVDAVHEFRVQTKARELPLSASASGGSSAPRPSFDFPQMSPHCVERSESTVATQALYLMNDSMVRELAASLAKRVEREVGTDPVQQVERVYWLAVSRAPTPAEKDAALTTLQKLGNLNAEAPLAKLCLAIFNTAAFIYID